MQPLIHSVPIEKTPYEQGVFPEIFIDVMWQCNMSCNMCYSDSPGPKFPVTTTSMNKDLDLDYYEDLCARLPRPVLMMLVGGEPSMSRDIFKILEITYKHGHGVFMPTNGKRFAKSISFCKEFAQISKMGKTVCCLDFSSGYNDEISDIIYGEPVQEFKTKALENIQKTDAVRVLLSSALIRDLNESVMPDLIDIADRFKKVVRILKFRAQGHTGRWIKESHSYRTPEMLKLLENYFTEEEMYGTVTLSGELKIGKNSEKCLGKNCCFHFKPKRHLHVWVLECFTEQGSCWRKGRLNDTGTLEPAFEAYGALTPEGIHAKSC
jgi:molybdenum cofactor biosynthesis enzyme MoaA|tara:strand:- start:121 stop:1086 length:966 start_codon:yes stop_codon:yes gene_type:complete